MRPLLLLLMPLCLSMSPTGPIASRPATAALPVVEIDPLTQLPTADQFAELARTDPVTMLEFCIARYQREIQGYRAVMEKHELINGKQLPREIVNVAFREHPFSVYMKWTEGADRAEASVFVAGENNDQLIIRPKSRAARWIVSYVTRDPESPDVREVSRFSVRDFGIQKGTIRTLVAWKAAKDLGMFRFEYLGIESVKEAGGRLCYMIRRDVNPPEEDGLTQVTIAIDVETWLQVGSWLKAGDTPIAEYHFRNIEPNPTFGPKQFKTEGLKE